MFMLSSEALKAWFTVISERSVQGVDEDHVLMRGIEYVIDDELSEDLIHYVTDKYPNVFIYKRDALQYIALFPRSINLLYNN